VDTVLVAGIETVAGANIAASLTDRFRVIGLTSQKEIEIGGCETVAFSQNIPERIKNILSTYSPQWVIYCGAAANSSWQGGKNITATTDTVQAGRNWAAECAKLKCRFTALSSDGIFTSPWMFHEEAGESFCTSPAGKTIRAMEQQILAANPQSLIVRTNTFGWSPQSETKGWLENLLDQLETGKKLDLDCIRHATPILATDLANLLEQAYQQRLQGTFHIGGAERINPVQFVQRLAHQFGLSIPLFGQTATLTEQPSGYGRGETSLQTRKARRALNAAMPMVEEGLTRLEEQQTNGFCARIKSGQKSLQEA